MSMSTGSWKKEGVSAAPSGCPNMLWGLNANTEMKKNSSSCRVAEIRSAAGGKGEGTEVRTCNRAPGQGSVADAAVQATASGAHT